MSIAMRSVPEESLASYTDEELNSILTHIDNSIKVFEAEVRDRQNDRNKIIFELKRRKHHE